MDHAAPAPRSLTPPAPGRGVLPIILCRLRQVALLLCMLPASGLAAAQTILPGFEQVRARYVASDALLLDRHGQPLADRRINRHVRRLEWVTLQSLPPAVREALLVAEDKRFFEHPGVDWKAFVGALWQNLWGTRRGGSTLTMQLAGLLDPALSLPDGGRARRSLTQKWDQGRAAMELERHWSKAQILEAYLNLAPFRGDLQGIDAASRLLLGLPTSELSRREAVILAVLLRGPNARPARVARRACLLATRLGSARLCNEITELAEMRLDAPRNRPRYTLAPHLARQLLNVPGQKLVTTLDAAMQRELRDALLAADGEAAGALVLDTASGEVLAWAGGLESDPHDAVITPKSLVGAWWPMAAALALERQTVTPASSFEDPQGMMISLRKALSHRIGFALRPVVASLPADVLAERVRQLGLAPAAAVEAPAEASLAQLTAAWRALMAGGQYVPANPLRAETGRRVLSPDAAFIVMDILGTPASSGWSAQWQAQSADARQAVLLVATEQHVVGLSLRALKPGEAGRNLAGVWKRLAPTLAESGLAPPPPDGVVSQVVVFDPPIEPPRREWFLRDPHTGAADIRYRRY